MQRMHVLLVILVIASLCGMLPIALRAGSGDRSGQPELADTGMGRERALIKSDAEILGLVQNARFVRLDQDGCPDTRPARLTTIQPWAAMSPEATEISLAAYEGRAIMVTGMDQGDWIYSAQIVDVAGPILSAVTRRVFDAPVVVKRS